MLNEIEINGTMYKIGDRVKGKYSIYEVQHTNGVEGTITSIDSTDEKMSLEVLGQDTRWVWLDNDTVEHVDTKKTYKYSFLID